jgi:Raf kinase inhibitor-like YbhB/YbcL family protein
MYMDKRVIGITALIILLFVGVISAPAQKGGMEMKLTSPEFKNNDFIPKKFTCQGEDINPLLTIEGVPKQAKSLALIVDDPDAPMGIWVHWVVFDILPASEIEENSISGKQGRNNSASNNYHGPCPPSGAHRYFFKLFALDTMLNLREGITKAELENAMKGHILAEAQLIGLYQKTR